MYLFRKLYEIQRNPMIRRHFVDISIMIFFETTSTFPRIFIGSSSILCQGFHGMSWTCRQCFSERCWRILDGVASMIRECGWAPGSTTSRPKQHGHKAANVERHRQAAVSCFAKSPMLFFCKKYRSVQSRLSLNMNHDYLEHIWEIASLES